MWFSSSGILELLFALSIIQGPFSMYQRLELIRLRCKYKIGKFLLLPTHHASCIQSQIPNIVYLFYSATREAISTLWNDSKSLMQSSDRRVAKIVAMQQDIEGQVPKCTSFLSTISYDMMLTSSFSLYIRNNFFQTEIKSESI